MKRYFWPITTAAVSVIVSALLMLSPWTFALNLKGHAWNNATQTFFWSGLGMLVLTLLATIFWIMALSRSWQEASVAPLASSDSTPEPAARDVRPSPRPAAPAPTPTAPPAADAPAGDEDLWEKELRQLAQEVLHDISGDHPSEPDQRPRNVSQLGRTSNYEGRD